MQEQDELQAHIHHLLARLHDHTYEKHHPPAEATEPITSRSEVDQEEPLETYHIYPVSDGIYITREEEAADERTIESTLTAEGEPEELLVTPAFSTTIGQTQRELPVFSFFLLALCLFMCIDMLNFYIMAQLMPTATITIRPITRELTATSTVVIVPGNPTTGQLQGRFFAPLTLSQTETAPATGKGHQNARSATGSILFYNGAYSPQFIPAGTIIASAGGIAIVTDQDATIPAANPPSLGKATVSAHALHAGQQGNIPSLAIDLPCCLPSVFAKNVAPFAGGQEARDFNAVTRQDIQRVETNLFTQLLQSERAALAARLTPGEALAPPICTQAAASDHQVGEEATLVAVTVSETCSAAAYDAEAFSKVAAQELMEQARKQLGTHFGLIAPIQLHVLRVTITDRQQESGILVVQAVGMYAYQFSLQELAQLKRNIQGRPRQEALRLLSGLPGLRSATIAGTEDDQPLPDNPNAIHILVWYGVA